LLAIENAASIYPGEPGKLAILFQVFNAGSYSQNNLDELIPIVSPPRPIYPLLLIT
jgi:hypothetical protein